MFFQWNSSRNARSLRQGVQLQSPAQLGVWLEQLLFDWATALAAGTFGLLGDFRGNFEIMPNFLGVMILYDEFRYVEAVEALTKNWPDSKLQYQHFAEPNMRTPK